MQRLIVIIAICLFGVLPGCASVAGYVPFQKDDPAARRPFPNIEVPSGMSPVSGGYVTSGPDGMTNGLACYEGYIAPSNLQYDMDASMRAQGWKAATGAGSMSRLMAVYTQGKRYAVIAIRSLTAGTALDVWVGSPARNGLLPLPYNPAPGIERGASGTGEGVVEGGGHVNTAPSSSAPARQESGLQEREL